MVKSIGRECKALRRVRTMKPGVFNSKVPTVCYKTDPGIQDLCPRLISWAEKGHGRVLRTKDLVSPQLCISF